MSSFFIDENIARAKTLSKDFYTSKEIFEESKEKLFAPSWQFIGDSDYVKNGGDVFPLTLLENFLNEPLLLTKDKNNELHCLSNVCTHRGNILIDKHCNVPHLRCRYHGRMFSTDGKFISMPEFKEVENFPSEEDNLSSLPLNLWGKFLFTTLENKFPADIFLKEMQGRMSWLPLEEFIFHPELSSRYEVNAHWALYCENYLEGFHIPFVHPGLNEVIDFGNNYTELFSHSNLQPGMSKRKEDCFEQPPASPDFGKNIAAYYFWIFPNMMFNFYPWGLSVNVITPLSIDKTRISFLTYIWKENKLKTGAGGDLHTVEMEDEQVVENVQRGIRSRFYNNGRYSVKREQGVHHFHRLISEFMK